MLVSSNRGLLQGLGKSRLTGVEQADDVETSFQQAMTIHLLDCTLEHSGATQIMPNGGLMPHNFRAEYTDCVSDP